jgi:hypothetical protein
MRVRYIESEKRWRKTYKGKQLSWSTGDGKLCSARRAIHAIGVKKTLIDIEEDREKVKDRLMGRLVAAQYEIEAILGDPDAAKFYIRHLRFVEDLVSKI